MEKIIISPGEVRGVGNIIEAGRTASDYQTYKSSVIAGNVEDIGGSNIRTYKMSWDGDHMIIDIAYPPLYSQNELTTLTVNCKDAGGNYFDELPELTVEAYPVTSVNNGVPVYGTSETPNVIESRSVGGRKFYSVSWIPEYRTLYKLIINVEDSGIFAGDTIISYIDVGR